VPESLRLGLIGAGRWGRNIIRTATALDDVVLMCVASRNPETVALVPRGCAVTPDWRSLVDRRGVDAVIVATPPALHAEMARACVEAGLPVLVEKPFTMNLAEAEALQALAQARGGLVMVDHTHLFHPAFRALKREAPRFGLMRAIRSEAGNHGPFRADTPVLWDWGPHDVAMCVDLLGSPPVGVHARLAESRRTERGLAEIVDLQCDFRGGVTARLRIGNAMPKRRWFAVLLERGVLVYDDLAVERLVYHARITALEGSIPLEGTPVTFTYQPPLACAVREFAAAAARGTDPSRSLDVAVDVTRVLAACQSQLVNR
jgi:predicted dehydrogenase